MVKKTTSKSMRAKRAKVGQKTVRAKTTVGRPVRKKKAAGARRKPAAKTAATRRKSRDVTASKATPAKRRRRVNMATEPTMLGNQAGAIAKI